MPSGKRDTTTPPMWHPWRIACALVAVAALFPAANAAGATPVQAGTGIATHNQELPVAATDAPAADAVSAGPLRTLAGVQGDGDSGSTTGRRLLRRGKKGRKGKKGKKGRKGKKRKHFPPTPEGEAQCTVSAVVEEVEFYDADFLHASAIAELFEMVCSEPDYLSLDHLVEVFVERDAAAFAHATAAAVVDCQSTNEDAMLCASVTATAHAAAQTLVTAHVQATATAIRGCGCQDDITAFGSSETFIALVAEATATATASACIYGTGRVVSTAYSTCTSYVFARVFARAAAQAIIEGNCLNGHSVAQLLLEADAIDVTAGSTCGGIAEAHVTPGTSVFDGPYDYDYAYGGHPYTPDAYGGSFYSGDSYYAGGYDLF